MIEIKEFTSILFSTLKTPGELSSVNSGWFNTQKEDWDFFIESNFYLNDGDKIWLAIDNKNLQGFLIYRDAKWDTEYFGFSSGKLEEFKVWGENHQIRSNFITLLLEEFTNYRKQINLSFCVASIDVWDVDIVKVIENYGFNFIVNWGSCFIKKENKNDLLKGYSIRDASIKDQNALQDLVQYYFKGGRFYLDNMFKKIKIDDLYKNLVVSSINDNVSEVKILHNYDGQIIGFFIYRKNERKNLIIGELRFLVFNPDLSIPGLASSFLSEITNDLLIECDIVTSGIELHNIPSMAIHLKSRFKFNHSRNVFHGWFND